MRKKGTHLLRLAFFIPWWFLFPSVFCLLAFLNSSYSVGPSDTCTVNFSWVQFWKVFSLIWQPSLPPRQVKDIVPLSSCFHSLFLTTKLFTYLSLLLSVHKAFLPLALWVPPPLLLALSNLIMMHVMDISPNVLWFGFTKSLQFVVLWFSSCWENFCYYFDSILMYGLCNRNA